MTGFLHSGRASSGTPSNNVQRHLYYSLVSDKALAPLPLTPCESGPHYCISPSILGLPVPTRMATILCLLCSRAFLAQNV